MPMEEFATEHPSETTMPLTELPMYHWQGTTESSAFESPTIPLQDAANFYFNVSSAGRPASYHIPAKVIAFALNACKSQRDLAGRSVMKIFTLHKRATSNCCGKLGKTVLNSLKVKAIYSTCISSIPYNGWKPRQ